jgi:hypothetical protein
MKIIIIIVILLSLSIGVNGQSQGSFSLQNSNLTSLAININSTITKSDLSYCTIGWYLGHSGSVKRRAFFQWNLPEAIIPDGSNVLSGRILITNIQSNNPDLIACTFSVRADLNTATGALLWDRTDIFNNHFDYLIDNQVESDGQTIDLQFDGSSPYAQAIEAALNDDFFTLGLIDKFEYQQSYVYDLSNCHVKLEFVYARPPVSVTVDQKRSSGSSTAEPIGRWQGGPSFVNYSVPQNFTFYVGTEEVLRGYQNVITNPDEKYRTWETYSDVTNHHVFSVTPSMTTLKSQFDNIYGNIVVKNNLLSGGSGGTIKFKDPWLIDYVDPVYGNNLRNQGTSAPFKDKTSPLNLTIASEYKGLFLNQSGPPAWQIPYYSVGAMSEQTIPFHGQDITWHFQNWSGDANKVAFQYYNQTETAVVFKANDAVAQANYKGHGASSLAAATGYNNGRKMVLYNGSPAVYHLVYADNNQVWYTSTNNGGQSWLPEVLISQPGTENNANPAVALATAGGTYIVYVTWEQSYLYPPGEDDYLMRRILLRKIYVNPSTGAIDLGVVQNISNDTFDSQSEARPAVWAEANDKIWVTWKAKQLPTPQNPNPVYKIYIRYYSTSWYPTAEVYADNGFPVIARSNTGYNRTKIVWSDGVKIKYIAGEYGGPWTSMKVLKDDSPAYYLVQPTFAIDDSTYGHLVYCGYYIYYVKYNLTDPANPQQMGSTVSLSTYDCSSPSIGVTGTGSSQIRTVFFSKTGTVYRKKYQNGTWTSTNFADGKYTSLADKSASGAVWTRFTSAPYLLKTDLGDGVLHKSAGNLEEECIIAKRFEFPVKVLDNTDDLLILDLENFSVNGNSLQFDDNLQSGSIALSGSNKIVMQWQARNIYLKQNTPLLRFYFKTDTEKYLLQTVDSADLLDKSPAALQNSSATVNFSCQGGLTGRIVIEFADAIPYHVTLLKGGEDDGSAAKSFTAADVNMIVPKEFSLSQNFPNPFNPVTQISYELPKSSHVSLKIYDTNGRLVSDLVKGYKEAGRYQVVFDGSRLASGVYFYRLETGSFLETKRMVLLR